MLRSIRVAVSLFALASASLVATPLLAEGQKPDLAITAIVGNDAISSYDVANRLKFIIVTAHLSDTPDVIGKIRPQVVRSLIDEKLQLREAAKNDIKVDQRDVEEAITSIEAGRGMTHGTIYGVLDANHIPRETFTRQIEAQIAWSKLLAKKIRPHVRVSDEDVALASQRGAPASKKKNAAPVTVQEIKMAAITLPVDKKERDAEIRRLGDKLVKELRGGADFNEVARHFSSVADGGKVETFWIKLSQLDPVVARTLSTATPGSITDPLRSSAGYTIIKVFDTRAAKGKTNAPPLEPEKETPKEIQVTLKEIVMKLKSNASDKEADAVLHVGEEVAKHPGTCEEKGVAGMENLKDFDIEVNFIEKPLSELPPAVRVIAENLKVGDISTPFASLEGLRLYMLCGKKDVDAKPVNREDVYRMLLQQKMELESQKYLRNLRRETFIDIR